MVYDVYDALVWSKVQKAIEVMDELCLCPGLQSTMDEEREEGGPTSKTTLSGEHGRRSKAKR
jgi:hypothetical protein